MAHVHKIVVVRSVLPGRGPTTQEEQEEGFVTFGGKCWEVTGSVPTTGRDWVLILTEASSDRCDDLGG